MMGDIFFQIFPPSTTRQTYKGMSRIEGKILKKNYLIPVVRVFPNAV